MWIGSTGGGATNGSVHSWVGESSTLGPAVPTATVGHEVSRAVLP